MNGTTAAVTSAGWWRPWRLSPREVLVALLGVLGGFLLVQPLHSAWTGVLWILLAGAGSAFLVLRRLPDPIPWTASLPLALVYLSVAAALGAGGLADLAAVLAGVLLVATVTVPFPQEASPAPLLTALQTLLPALAGVLAFLVAVAEGPTTAYLPVVLVVAIAALAGVVLLFDRVAGTAEEGPEGREGFSGEAS